MDGGAQARVGGVRLDLQPIECAMRARARLVGLRQSSHLNGVNVTLRRWLPERRRWAVTAEEGDGTWLRVREECLQVVAAAPAVPPTVAEAARAASCGWARRMAAESKAIASALEEHASGLRDALDPVREPSVAIDAAYREARRNFADVDEVRDALKAMDVGKTGRSLAVEHLVSLPDEQLRPWLTVTEMVYAGEAVDELKLGTCTPAPKDL
jgi:hypothetical protein